VYVIQKSGAIILRSSAIQTFISTTIKDDSLQGTYKVSNRWVIVCTTVQTNSAKCVLKSILIQVTRSQDI